MLRLDEHDVHGTLVRCFEILRASVPSTDWGVVGSKSHEGRINKQTDLALAAKVVRVIDHKMPPLPRAFFNFVYSDTAEIHPAYGLLAAYLRNRLTAELAGEDSEDFRYAVMSLTMLAPWEVKHRIYNCRGSLETKHGMLHSSARLAELLGIKRTWFVRRYSPYWRSMLQALLEVGYCHEHMVADRMRELRLMVENLEKFKQVS